MLHGKRSPTSATPHAGQSSWRRSGRWLLFSSVVIALTACPQPPEEEEDPCPGQDYCAGNYPPGYWVPYDVANNPFYTPLSDAGTDAHLRQHSTLALSGPVSDKPGNLVADEAGTGGEPTYWSDLFAPEFTLNCINDEYGRLDHGCPIDSTQLGGFKLRVPAGAKPEGARAIVVGQPRVYDSHMIIIDQQNGWEYDLWQVQSTSSLDKVEVDGTVTTGLSASGGKIDFSWGGRTRWNGTDGTAPNRPAGDPVDDSNAAHWAESLGRVRAEELMNGEINHALFIVLPCTAATNSVFPADPVGRGRACGQGGVQAAVGTHPLGTRLWLDMTDAEIDQLPVPGWKKIFLHAMSRYGMFVGDTGGAGWLFYIETEGGVMYTSIGGWDRWYRFADDNMWEPYTPPGGSQQLIGKLYAAAGDTYDWAGQVWTKLRVLEPCITPQTGNPC
jgi:hypothetical protein